MSERRSHYVCSAAYFYALVPLGISGLAVAELRPHKAAKVKTPSVEELPQLLIHEASRNHVEAALLGESNGTVPVTKISPSRAIRLRRRDNFLILLSETQATEVRLSPNELDDYLAFLRLRPGGNDHLGEFVQRWYSTSPKARKQLDRLARIDRRAASQSRIDYDGQAKLVGLKLADRETRRVRAARFPLRSQEALDNEIRFRLKRRLEHGGDVAQLEVAGHPKASEKTLHHLALNGNREVRRTLAARPLPTSVRDVLLETKNLLPWHVDDDTTADELVTYFAHTVNSLDEMWFGRRQDFDDVEVAFRRLLNHPNLPVAEVAAMVPAWTVFASTRYYEFVESSIGASLAHTAMRTLGTREEIPEETLRRWAFRPQTSVRNAIRRHPNLPESVERILAAFDEIEKLAGTHLENTEHGGAEHFGDSRLSLESARTLLAFSGAVADVGCGEVICGVADHPGIGWREIVEAIAEHGDTDLFGSCMHSLLGGVVGNEVQQFLKELCFEAGPVAIPASRMKDLIEWLRDSQDHALVFTHSLGSHHREHGCRDKTPTTECLQQAVNHSKSLLKELDSLNQEARRLAMDLLENGWEANVDQLLATVTLSQ